MLSSDVFSLGEAQVNQPERLEKYIRFVNAMDPLADEVVGAFSQLPSGRGRKLLDAALDHGIGAAPDAPPALRRLFAQLDDVPLWVDWDQLDLGGRVVLRSGLCGAIALGLYALAKDYAAPAGAKPLVFSGALIKRASRRLAETGRFAVASCQPGGLRRYGDGFKTTVRVRLMHAQVRRLILRSGRWSPGWGAPINQAFMAGTIVSLSYILLDGLRQLGWRLPEAEREAVMQLWRYSAYLSGVPAELSPATQAESKRLSELIVGTSAPPDDDSRVLVSALMNVRLFPGTEKLPFMSALYAGLSRALLGNHLADQLHLPKTAWRFVIWPLRAAVLLQEGLRRLPGGDGLAFRLGCRTWHLALNSALRGKPADYELPERLEPAMIARSREKRYV